jgi:hypothetical protein
MKVSNKTQSIDTLQNKIRTIERVIVRHAATAYNQQHGSVWFGDMADMCTERKDLKKMLKKLLTAI